ncbi:MAG: tRNA (N6-threonylcarbamoyladenosine(37)-N6)-methyltransferase TrmO [Chloroflexi bacterium]|nr:tRNA (N6-threonylcarbamoyladenosine(37)-N6)-methyltransferase TrmO [Chloroflexota bacterium]
MALTAQQIADTVAFHGHLCPGLAWGMRISEAALAVLGARDVDEELIAVVETDNCAVDAIQFLMGCTFGKGNLRYLDRGQNIFTFARRADGRAVRISRNPAWQMPEGALDQSAHTAAIMSAPAADLLLVEELADYIPPDKAQILPSRPCAACGQPTMASRLQTLAGRELCPACLADELANAAMLHPIGVIRNELIAGAAPSRARSARSVIELDERFAPALLGIEENSLLQVLYLLDRAPLDAPLQQHRKTDPAKPLRGVFSLRSPHRPNPLGLTTVRLLEVVGSRLVVAGLDAWDGTPLLDIKPYAPEWDDGENPATR